MRTVWLLILTFNCVLLAATAAAADDLVIRGVSAIPMTGGGVSPGQTIVIRDGRIAAIGPAGEIDAPRNARVIDGAGLYAIPGLCDLHVHFFGGRQANPGLLKLYVANGVTTVLNMRGNRGMLEMRGQINDGELVGPTLYTTSPILGNVSPTPATRAEGMERVERFHDDGYDFIKVYNYIPEEGYAGVIEAARRLDIPVVGHAVRSVGLEGALESGQHLAHMEEVLYGYFADGLDESKIPELAQRVKDSGISVIATLIVYHNIIRQVQDIDAMLASPGMEYLHPRVTASWQPDRNDYLANFDAAEVETELQPAFAFEQKLTKAFVDAGVPVLLGTDACNPIVVPGYSVHDELIELVNAGMSPREALAAGTVEAARFLGGEETFGTLEAGKRADLVLLTGNPLEDIRHSRDIAGVVLRGDWFDGPALEDMLEELRRENAAGSD